MWGRGAVGVGEKAMSAQEAGMRKGKRGERLKEVSGFRVDRQRKGGGLVRGKG